jgi:hypothetical protein
MGIRKRDSALLPGFALNKALHRHLLIYPPHSLTGAQEERERERERERTSHTFFIKQSTNTHCTG